MRKIIRTASEPSSGSNGSNGSNGRSFSRGSSGPDILDEDSFARMLYLERKRTQRSERRFILMLLDAGRLLRGGRGNEAVRQAIQALTLSTRETDIRGWYQDAQVLGVIFTEIGAADGRDVARALLDKITLALSSTLGIEHISDVRLSFHIFPDDWENGGPDGPVDSRLYPDLVREMDGRRGPWLVKRALDVLGSLGALLVLSPLFLAIAIAIKLTSPGPVFYRQHRLGYRGRKFTLLKFRSMKPSSDTAVHQQYMKELIAGQAAGHHNGNGQVYKLTDDDRITRIGRFLRRTSLDELPQFLQVLTGQMSLVGPRPPIPYELACYKAWHKPRLLRVKPGITGLWQVSGRNRLRFDEMVRLDLEYARTWTVWKDIQILLKTPMVVLSSDGAV